MEQAGTRKSFCRRSCGEGNTTRSKWKALHEMKNGKADCLSEMHSEMIKSAEKVSVEELTKIAAGVLERKEMQIF